MKVSVLLGEDNPVFMKGLESKLEKEANITLITKNDPHISILDFIILHRPDIVIADIDYNGEKNGFPLLQQVNRACVDAPRAIAYSDCPDPEIFGAFFHYGGWGYELKNCPEDEIGIAIRCVSRGTRFICSSLGGESIYFGYRTCPPPIPEKMRKLSPMERKAFAIVREGGTAKDVARDLGMSVSTAEKHITRIMHKLDTPCQEILRKCIWLSKP